MGSLDAHKDEIIPQLIEGDWKRLFPKNIYSDLVSWFKRRKSKDCVIRFIFCHLNDNLEQYAIYLLCKSKIKSDGSVNVLGLKYLEEIPLAIPPVLYEKPLYCMPSDLAFKIIKKKRKRRDND